MLASRISLKTSCYCESEKINADFFLLFFLCNGEYRRFLRTGCQAAHTFLAQIHVFGLPKPL